MNRKLGDTEHSSITTPTATIDQREPFVSVQGGGEKLIQHGSVSRDWVNSAPSQSGWNGGVSRTAIVTFDESFATTPSVVTGADLSLTSRGTLAANTPSATGFDLVFTHFADTESSIERDAHWLAVGDR